MNDEQKPGGRAVVLSALFGAVLLAGCESDEKRALLYGAWCKTNDCGELTQKEWQALREQYLLPGQCRDTSSDALMAGVVAGSIAAGSASGRRR